MTKTANTVVTCFLRGCWTAGDCQWSHQATQCNLQGASSDT